MSELATWPPTPDKYAAVVFTDGPLASMVAVPMRNTEGDTWYCISKAHCLETDWFKLMYMHTGLHMHTVVIIGTKQLPGLDVMRVPEIVLEEEPSYLWVEADWLQKYYPAALGK